MIIIDTTFDLNFVTDHTLTDGECPVQSCKVQSIYLSQQLSCAQFLSAINEKSCHLIYCDYIASV